MADDLHPRIVRIDDGVADLALETGATASIDWLGPTEFMQFPSALEGGPGGIMLRQQ